MAKLAIFENVGRSVSRLGLQVKKHSPELLIIGGVIGIGAGFVMGCRATLKASTVIEEAKKDIEDIHEKTEKGELNSGEKYTEEDSQKDLAAVYLNTGLQVAKIYAPAVIIETLSIAAILSSNHIQRTRIAGLMAAYATLDKGFKGYRGRVVERFGEDMDRELLYNIKAKEVEETIVNEDGSETVVKKTVEIVDPNELGEYTRFFAEGDPGWTKDPELNKMYLVKQCAYANEKLRIQGHLFLNELYDMMGWPRTAAGAVVGWIYDSEEGDGYVDFGIYNTGRLGNINFVNGDERNCLLCFNVDGVIYDKI